MRREGRQLEASGFGKKQPAAGAESEAQAGILFFEGAQFSARPIITLTKRAVSPQHSSCILHAQFAHHSHLLVATGRSSLERRARERRAPKEKGLGVLKEVAIDGWRREREALGKKQATSAPIASPNFRTCHSQGIGLIICWHSSPEL